MLDDLTGSSDHIVVEAPGFVPDNRVLDGQIEYAHPTPLGDLAAGATHIRGVVSGLDPHGLEWLRTMVGRTEVQHCSLVFALYGGCRTWDDVLIQALAIQNANPSHIEFRVLARRLGPDRPANLIWFQKGKGDAGIVVTGNVGNGFVVGGWDATDAVLALPLDAAGANAIRLWFDQAFLHGRPLTKATASAPRLRLPEGTEEGERLWRVYLATLDDDAPATAIVTTDLSTGEVHSSAEATPSQSGEFPQPDPVLQAVQIALAKGSVVALDRAGRAPPLSAPLKAEYFGERAETTSGAALRQQSFKVSLFDAATSKRLETRRGEMTNRLARTSLMLRDGVRWVPGAADALLEAEFDEAKRLAGEALTAATSGKPAETFITERLKEITRNCADLARTIAPGREPPADLVTVIKEDLTQRLQANRDHGMVPGFNRSKIQISSAESDREGPWDQIATFLAAAARLPREVLTDRYRMQGLVADPDEFIKAFDIFGDPLVAQHLRGSRMVGQARADMQLVDEITRHTNANSKQRAHALFCLITGQGHDAAKAALTDDKAPQ
ncbi:MAG TPA: hypothetical protein VMV33_17515 [Rhodocyclaceae bacterium]|nr:hypothetical protein [Rhodocyclaceae bacterium]